MVLFCAWWLGVSADGMGRKVLSNINGVGPVLFETGFWDLMIYIWAIWAVIAILAISMARSKNVGKGKASSSSMGQAVKKRKSDASQPVKRGRENELHSLRKVRNCLTVMMMKYRQCLPRTLSQSTKNGPGQLQKGVFTARGA